MRYARRNVERQRLNNITSPGPKHTSPIELRIFLLELGYSLSVHPEINPTRSSPLSGLQLQDVPDNFPSEIPDYVNLQMREKERVNVPWELSLSLVTIIDAFFLLRSLSNTLDDVPITLLSLVIKLNHEVWQVGNHCTSERAF